MGHAFVLGRAAGRAALPGAVAAPFAEIGVEAPRGGDVDVDRRHVAAGVGLRGTGSGPLVPYGSVQRRRDEDDVGRDERRDADVEGEIGPSLRVGRGTARLGVARRDGTTGAAASFAVAFERWRGALEAG